MISRCFTWFPIIGLGEPNIYHDLGIFYKNRRFYLEGVWLWRISGVPSGLWLSRGLVWKN